MGYQHRLVGMGNGQAVFVEGARSAFVKAMGAYEDFDALELISRITAGLLQRLPLAVTELDEMIVGTVIPQTKNPNLGRDTILNLGWPGHIHAYTLNRTCLSSLQAVINACQTISYGKPHLILTGGVECLSDFPIVYSREARKFLVKLAKAKSAAAKLNILKNFRAKAWLPSPPEWGEPLTGLTLGEHVELMVQAGAISRHEQDQYALLSHQRAAEAQTAGYFAEEIIPLWPPPDYRHCIERDEQIRLKISLDELSQLAPAFDKSYGTLTAGNSSPLSDGAAIALIADEKRALALGLQPKLRLCDYELVAVKPSEQLLIGPAIAIPRLLARHNLGPADIDRYEIHEAFAAQVLCCLRAVEDPGFCHDHLGLSKAFGPIPLERVNVHGGAIAIGHPFAATGVRLLTSMARQLQEDDKGLGVVAMCGAGGMAIAMLVERWL